MGKRYVTYTQPIGGRVTYYRAGQAFPHGVTVEIDTDVIGAYAMGEIERDPRLKVSDVSADAVREAAASDVEMTEEEVEAFTGRILATFAGLPQDGFTKAGLPRVPFVRDALPAADQAYLTAELVERAWARRTAPVADAPTGPIVA